MKAIILANGELCDPDFAKLVLLEGDYIIACDGGLRHCHALGILPNYIIGDLDSVEPWLLNQYPNVPLIQFPIEKDQTDLELALAHACDLGVDTVIVLAGLGGRIDHQLGNVHALAETVTRGIRSEMWDERSRVGLIKDYCRLHTGDGVLVTMLPLTTTVDGVRTIGLKYPLNEETLTVGSSLGVSNQITGAFAEVSLKAGLLIVIQTKT